MQECTLAFPRFRVRILAFPRFRVSAFPRFRVSAPSCPVQPPPLACTVRGCHQPLGRTGQSWVCMRGHSFDAARRGYVNLLQPQDRKSLEAGDSREAVEARAGLIQAGIGRAAIDVVVSCAAQRMRHFANAVVVELGSGSGETLGTLAATLPIVGIGIDLSTHAATHAARCFPSLTWVVANADRRLPLLEHAVDLLVSVHARRNPGECLRVLRPGGLLIVAIPAADDLVELREAVLGEGVRRDRVPDLVQEHAGAFTVVERVRASQRVDLERPALLQLLRGTYRGERLRESPRVDLLDRLVVTLASDIVVLAPRPT